MAKRKYEFKPDPDGSGILNKLYLTASQRRGILKWSLYGLVFLVCLVIQDAMLSRFTFFGGIVDLATSVIMLVCVCQGVDAGCVFAFAAGAVYAFSGSAPGNYIIILVTVVASVVAAFRESYLRRGYASDLLCAVLGVALYELGLFLVGLVMEYTHTGRLGCFVMTALLSAAVIPALYPLVQRIGGNGGEIWKE